MKDRVLNLLLTIFAFAAFVFGIWIQMNNPIKTDSAVFYMVASIYLLLMSKSNG